MRYVTFGRTGLRVSELAFGLMRLRDREEASRMLALYAEAGGNFLDTADRYGRGASEELLGGLLGADRDRFVVATKYTLERTPGDVNSAGNQSLTSSSRRTCSGDSSTSRQPRFSLSCRSLVAPTSGITLPGLPRSQASATWAGSAPDSSATASTAR